MKLLFDQNLSHRLPARLTDIFPQSAHVRPLALDRASDTVIWDYVRQHGYVVVTQDADFVERSKLLGSPPKVIRLCRGNTTPQIIEAMLRGNFDAIVEFTQSDTESYLQIF